MKKTIVMASCLFTTYISAQDLAQKLTDLKGTLENLSQALSGDTTSHNPPPPPPPPVDPNKDKPKLPSPNTEFNKNFVAPKSIAVGPNGQLNDTTGNKVSFGKIDYVYYGIVKDTIPTYAGKLVLYVPEVAQDTTANDFFSVTGQLIYPIDKKKSDTFAPFILFDPAQDQKYQTEKQQYDDYNTKASLLAQKITKTVADIVNDYPKGGFVDILNQKKTEALLKDTANKLNSYVQSLATHLSGILPGVTYISQSNFEGLSKNAQQFTDFLTTFNLDKKSIKQSVDSEKANSKKKTLESRFAAVYNMFTLVDVVNAAFNDIKTKKPLLLQAQNESAKKLYSSMGAKNQSGTGNEKSDAEQIVTSYENFDASNYFDKENLTSRINQLKNEYKVGSYTIVIALDKEIKTITENERILAEQKVKQYLTGDYSKYSTTIKNLIQQLQPAYKAGNYARVRKISDDIVTEIAKEDEGEEWH